MKIYLINETVELVEVAHFKTRKKVLLGQPDHMISHTTSMDRKMSGSCLGNYHIKKCEA